MQHQIRNARPIAIIDATFVFRERMSMQGYFGRSAREAGAEPAGCFETECSARRTADDHAKVPAHATLTPESNA